MPIPKNPPVKNRRLRTSCVGVALSIAVAAASHAQLLPGPGPRAQVRGSATPAPERSLFSGDKVEPDKKAEPPEKKEKGPTEIVALEATFDQKAHVAVFIGEVVVTDPEFNVLCDKLTAYLKHDEDKPADAEASPPGRLRVPATPGPATTDPKGGSAAPAPKKASGLEKAIADADPGKIVTVTQDKKQDDGTINHSIGHGKKAVYDSPTGDITLTGKPDVQQGLNTCVATDESTVMVLNRDGHMRVTGPHKTIIKDQGDLTK
jgi:lipopolysaccharide export system protein LptA